jgi:penicillin-binding protein 1C
VRYGLYAPKNFDDKFHGTVTMRHALQKSLNIPAVKLLAALQPARFSARFRYAGLHKAIPQNLAIALGGVGFSLENLARAYMHIANPEQGGRLKRLREQALKTSLQKYHERPLMSERAAFYVSHILRGAPPPKNAKPGALAYKTGTSYGYRDGWAIGFDGRHLVAVWIGRPDGTATTNLTGIGAAGPLLFDAFQYISEDRVPFKRPPEGIIFANGDELPPPLRHFDKKTLQHVSHHGRREGRDVKIAFPPKGAEFLMRSQARGRFQIALKATGGKLPLTWLVNGKMISSKAHRRQNFYKPDERGFIEFSVIDAKGKTDRVEVRVR